MDQLAELIALAEEYEHQLPPAVVGIAPRGAEIAAWIDHTLLKPEATTQQIRQLCQEALHYRFTAVCINPVYVPLASEILAGSPSAVCTVIGFPLGATMSANKVSEALDCLSAGAKELDMVIRIGALKEKAYEFVFNDIAGVVEAAHSQQAIVKVIIENALLTQGEKIIACLLSRAARADYVKTSTGFAPSGATVQDVDLMRRVVGAQMGVKAAGGVRTLAEARAMIAAGATRIGASAGVQIVQQAVLEDNVSSGKKS